METFATWKFLHIAAMFFGLALALSGEIVIRRVASTRDVHAIRVVVNRVKPLSGSVATVLILAGLAFGLLAAVTGQMNLLAGWLILAYVTFGLAMVLGITISDPWVARLERAAASSPDDEASPELVTVIEDRRALVATIALMALVVAIVFIMVVKPLT